MPSFLAYKALVEQHKKIYYDIGHNTEYEKKYWIYSDVSWRDLDSHVRRDIIMNLESKVSKGEL